MSLTLDKNVPMCPHCLELEAKIAQLRLRVAELSATHRRGINDAVRGWLSNYSGEFSSIQIAAALQEQFPDRELVAPVGACLRKLAARGQIEAVELGHAGRKPNVYRKDPGPIMRPGLGIGFGKTRRGSALARVRAILDDLPPEFTVRDIRRTLEIPAADGHIRRINMNGVMHHLVKTGELLVCGSRRETINRSTEGSFLPKTSVQSVRRGWQSCKFSLNLYRIGTRRVGQTGEIKETESAWRKFREELATTPSPTAAC